MTALPSVAQIMTRSGLAARHVEPETQDHDWNITGRCEQCRGPIYTTRKGPNYGRQIEHTPACVTTQRRGPTPDRQ